MEAICTGVYIVFTTGRPLCHEVLPRALARGKKLKKKKRNKSWKPDCVGTFNMDWRIYVF
jgi:hypothetical protein